MEVREEAERGGKGGDREFEGQERDREGWMLATGGVKGRLSEDEVKIRLGN